MSSALHRWPIQIPQSVWSSGLQWIRSFSLEHTWIPLRRHPLQSCRCSSSWLPHKRYQIVEVCAGRRILELLFHSWFVHYFLNFHLNKLIFFQIHGQWPNSPLLFSSLVKILLELSSILHRFGMYVSKCARICAIFQLGVQVKIGYVCELHRVSDRNSKFEIYS